MSSAPLPKMDDVFKSHPRPEVIKDLLVSRRLQTIDLLQNVFPSKILYLRDLLAGEKDPSSPFWGGLIDSDDYNKMELHQPDRYIKDREATKKIEVGSDSDTEVVDSVEREIILPKDIYTEGVPISTSKDETNRGKEGEAIEYRIGAHFFEVFDTNKSHMKAMEIVEQELIELFLNLSDLRVWIKLEVPVIEDGNSFGAEVQEHLLKSIDQSRSRINMLHSNLLSHHRDRARFAELWASHPNFMDYPAMIAMGDRHDKFVLHTDLRVIIEIYGGLLTEFERNWTKVINPKGNHSSGGMY
ncbi:hypothetical protein CI109_104808 [Kwoniella shandongensis]|uniref:Uncharacterized protein n=1 Tax=Kwoniella shandongensis TaxID=1734106 RepID=A0A5M6BPH5_9TREE|nr:uncharacterized protein CI109_006892 [Kwoniella shandongensis]KAA5524804.1 hypothetical protein CI109_006892 [Kwoniella shandongensis]